MPRKPIKLTQREQIRKLVREARERLARTQNQSPVVQKALTDAALNYAAAVLANVLCGQGTATALSQLVAAAYDISAHDERMKLDAHRLGQAQLGFLDLAPSPDFPITRDDVIKALEPFAAMAKGRDAWDADSGCGAFPKVRYVRAAASVLRNLKSRNYSR